GSLGDRRPRHAENEADQMFHTPLDEEREGFLPEKDVFLDSSFGPDYKQSMHRRHFLLRSFPAATDYAGGVDETAPGIAHHAHRCAAKAQRIGLFEEWAATGRRRQLDWRSHSAQ